MAKFANKEEAKAAVATAKEEAKAAKSELRAFEKEKGLAKGEDHSGNEKHGKRWKKLSDAYAAKEQKVEKLQAQAKELKAEKKPRPSKYEYPADIVTAADKKKYRAKMRAEAKRAEKGEKPKKEKKAEKAEKSEKSEKAAKKEKKAKKEAVED